MRAVLYTTLSFLLIGCGNSNDAADREISDGSRGSSIYANEGKQIAWNDRGKEAIRAKLKDPGSAEFRNVEFYSGGGAPVTCGEVNAKNSFGGFNGFERFVAAGDVLTVMESEMGDGEMDKLWQQMCR